MERRSTAPSPASAPDGRAPLGPPRWQLVERRGTATEAHPAADVLVHGDSLSLAQEWPAGTAACVYIDPPFGTGIVRRGRGHDYRDVNDDPETFVRWLSPWLVASRSALSESGSLFVHLDYRAVHYVKVELDRLFGRARMVNEIVWCYSVGGKSRRGFGRKHDTILWYARGKEWAFYPDAVRIERRAGSHMRVVIDEHGRSVQEKTDRKTGRVYRYPVAAGKIPEDWWSDIETLNHSDRERTGWPSQKPERLVERILRATTVERDLVADWFCGSGTTAAVAQRLRRGFVTGDREARAVELAKQRLLQGLGPESNCAGVLELWREVTAESAESVESAGLVESHAADLLDE